MGCLEIPGLYVDCYTQRAGSLTGEPAGGVAWLWSSPALFPSSHMGILVGFGEETPIYWDMEVWTRGQACFVSFLPFPISIRSGWDGK